MAINALIESLNGLNIDGTFYAGYPILASADKSHTIEALVVSKEYGLIAFNFPETKNFEEVKEIQDELFYLIEGNLKRHEILRKGRNLAIEPNIISFYPDDFEIENGGDYLFACPSTIKNTLNQCRKVLPEFYVPLCSAIERVTTIKPTKKRDNVKKEKSYGAILKIIEKEIANLDRWQKKAAIEVPEGIQRVRGLAGSGKTVVLALKAAYLHSQHPDWDIAVTYHTRSLKQQFIDLIERFTFEHSGDKPNFNKLHILHSWGSSDNLGIYSTVATKINLNPINYVTAKSKFGVSDAFAGICREILSYMKTSNIEPMYDAILIDEAQDLPSEFFKIVYKIVKNPKRIIIAYDELQNLKNTSMLPIEELFGNNEDGTPLVTLQNIDNEPKRDIILPICYRNTPWALTIAHGLGFGTSRKKLVQHFEDVNLWNDIGYNVEAGELKLGKNVILKRKVSAAPEYFNELLTAEDSVISKKFNNEIEQYEWVAEQIKKNIEEDELDLDDILVIFPDAIMSQKQYQTFANSMNKRNLDSHLAGISTGKDIFTRTDSVAAASIYRAKGNEAPMVYIVNSDYCAIGQEMIKLRNILFTAITRSRAWVRILGVGDGMDILEQEISEIRNSDYKLSFKIPTQPELEEIRLINRDRTKEENNKILKAQKSLKEIKELIESGILSPDTLPELQTLLNISKNFNTEIDINNEG